MPYHATSYEIQVSGAGHGSRTRSRSKSSPTAELAAITKHLISASLTKGSTTAYMQEVMEPINNMGSVQFRRNKISSAFTTRFYSSLYSLNYASSTVTSYLSAIGKAHKLLLFQFWNLYF